MLITDSLLLLLCAARSVAAARASVPGQPDSLELLHRRGFGHLSPGEGELCRRGLLDRRGCFGFRKKHKNHGVHPTEETPSPHGGPGRTSEASPPVGIMRSKRNPIFKTTESLTADADALVAQRAPKTHQLQKQARKEFHGATATLTAQNKQLLDAQGALAGKGHHQKPPPPSTLNTQDWAQVGVHGRPDFRKKTVGLGQLDRGSSVDTEDVKNYFDRMPPARDYQGRVVGRL